MGHGVWAPQNIGEEWAFENQESRLKDILFVDRVTSFTNAAVLFRHSAWTFGFIKDWTSNCIRYGRGRNQHYKDQTAFFITVAEHKCLVEAMKGVANFGQRNTPHGHFGWLNPQD